MTTSSRPTGRFIHAVTLFLVLMHMPGCGEKTASIEQWMSTAANERSRGNYEAAIIHLRNVLQEVPQNVEARYQIGMVYLAISDYLHAEKELRRAQELHYSPLYVTVPLARALLGLGEPQKVLDEIKLPVGADGELEAQVLALRGLAAIELQRGKEARAMFEQALTKQPNLADALRGQARLALGEGRFDEAATLIERIIASAPTSADAWLMKADLNRALRTGDPVADYRKVLELSPANMAARLGLISLEITKKNFAEADKLLTEAMQRAPRNGQVKYAQALLEFNKKNYPAAREAALKVLEVAPNHLPAIVLAGAIEHGLGAHLQAQSYLTRAIERMPANLYTRRLLVSSLQKSGQSQKALEVLQLGLAQAPNDIVLIGMAGELAMQIGDYAKAREYFDRAAKLAPKSVEARTGLALSRQAAGDVNSGLADLEAATQLDSHKHHADALLIATHLQHSRYDQALKAAEALEKKQPKNPLTYNLKAAAYLGKKDNSAARRELDRALELQATYVPAALNLSQLDLQDNNPRQARHRLESILEKEPGNSQALLALANLASRLSASPKEQEQWLQRAVQANPRMAQPRIMLANFLLQIGESKRALDVAQEAAAVSPDNPDVLYSLGSIQFAAGEKNQAVTTYTRITGMQPKSHIAFYRLADVQAANADTAGAVSSLRKALALKPNFADAQIFLAELDARSGRYAEALAAAKQLQKQVAKSPAGHVLEGDVLMAEKKHAQAIKAYETAYALATSGTLAMKLHAAYRETGRLAEAEARLTEWLKAAPNDATIRMYAAHSYLKTGEFRKSVEQYEWLRQRKPDDIVVLNNLAWAYQQIKDGRAVETAERAYKLQPDSPIVTDTLGWILVELGETKRGIDLLQKALSAAPKSQEIRYHLSQAWLKAGDKIKAREELERLLLAPDKFPQQAEALMLLQELRK